MSVIRAGLVVAALLACACVRRANCEADEVCMSEAVFQVCMEDRAALDEEIRALRSLAAKAMLCVAQTDHDYLLRALDRPACAECIGRESCHDVWFDNACRPDCLREP